MPAPWVCLMYHDITPAPVQGGGGPSRFAVPLAEFTRQLDQLCAQGLHGCTLRAAMDAADARSVAITFDDGEIGQFERGFRALVARGMTATFFVTTDWVGRAGHVSWDQLQEMRAAGMDVQSHARSHRFLSELSLDELTGELRGAKEALDGRLGQDTDMLALPGGDWPRRAHRAAIPEAGYRVVATSAWGLNRTAPAAADPPVVVRRCTVSGSAGASEFGRIVAGNAWLKRRRRLREGLLGALRSVLGPSRYAAWRRTYLDTIRA